MAWNRPSAANQQPAQKSGSKAPSAMRGVIAGAVVVVLGALCFFIFSGKDARQDAASTKERGKIKDVAPAKAPTNAVSAAKVETKDGKPIRKFETYVDENGIERYKGGARVPRKNPKIVKLPTGRPVEFKHYAENAIEGIVMIEPGDIVVGEITYGDDFIKDFNDSLAEPIKIEPTDTPFQRRIKEDVIAAKQDLYEAMNRGEDVAKIMTEARKEMRRLFELQNSIEGEVRTLLDKEENTPQDIDDITAAANKLLKEKGLPELKMPRATIRRMKRNLEKKQKEGNAK